MLFVFGTKTVGSTLKEGSFFCDECNQNRKYRLKSNRLFLSIFWIPIIPLNKVADTLVCDYCKTAYIPNSDVVTNYISPTAEIDNLDRPLASYRQRIGGLVIDIVVLVILKFVLTIIAAQNLADRPERLLYFTYGIWIMYFFLMEWLAGGTIGKKIVGIKTITEEELTTISVFQHLVRSVIKLVPFINIIALFNVKRKGAHDFAANTIVVEK